MKESDDDEMLDGEKGRPKRAIRNLCPTRWTVKGSAMASIIENHEELEALWEVCLSLSHNFAIAIVHSFVLKQESGETVTDREMKARIRGVEAMMKKFSIHFGLHLGKLILGHTDNLSSSLQSPTVSAADGQDLMQKTVSTLKSIRNDSDFEAFYGKVCRSAADLDIEEPAMARKRKRNKRYEAGTGPEFFHETPEQKYKADYFQALDFVAGNIEDRFQQEGYKMYLHLQQFLLKAAQGDHEAYSSHAEAIVSFYGDSELSKCGDIHRDKLFIQARGFHNEFKGAGGVAMGDVHSVFASLSDAERQYYSQLLIVYQLLLVMPASNAVSERSFSSLKLVKTYLRNSMGQERLNHLLILHIHSEETDRIDVDAVIKDFIVGREGREAQFQLH